MALVVSTLQQAFQAAFQKQLANTTSTPEEALAELSTDLSNAVDAYIKTGSVVATCAPGQVVAGTAGPNPVTAATTSAGTVTGAIE